MPSRHRSAHASAQGQDVEHLVAGAAEQTDPRYSGGRAHRDHGRSLDIHRAHAALARERIGERGSTRAAPTRKPYSSSARGKDGGRMSTMLWEERRRLQKEAEASGAYRSST